MTRCHCGMSGVVGVHFSPSRTSRPVGCRPTARMVDCCVAFTRVTWQTYGAPGLLPGGIERLKLVSSRTLRAFWLFGSLVPLGNTDLVPLPGARRAVKPRMSSNGLSVERIPVSDAIALGTFRTRLETRTKESNMCASHWDFF